MLTIIISVGLGMGLGTEVALIYIAYREDYPMSVLFTHMVKAVIQAVILLYWIANVAVIHAALAAAERS